MKKVVFITGATAGFGYQTARVFAHAGWDVVISGRRKDRLETVAEELSKVTNVFALPLDVRDRDAVTQLPQTLPKEFNQIHTLVNNAGLALGLDPVHNANLDDWDVMVDTNVKGLIYVTRAFLPSLIKVGAGTIINIGSIAGKYPYPGGNVYGATKAFVNQFSLSLRSDLEGTGVRVTNIAPGMAKTDFSLVRFKGDVDRADGVYKNAAPLTADDIAKTAFWVANAPAHVNFNIIEMMPTSQSFAALKVHTND